jgi:hypothetical protein
VENLSHVSRLFVIVLVQIAVNVTVFLRVLGVKTEEFVVMANVFVNQIILEKIVKLCVIMVLSILSQDNAFANQIMKDLLVNSVNV